MRLEDFMNEYPIYHTISGFYMQDISFSKDIYNDDRLLSFFQYVNGSVPLVYYNGHEFECWYFVYDRVSGYYTEDGKDWYLTLRLEELETYEFIDPYHNDLQHLVFVLSDTEKELPEIIAQDFNIDVYNNEHIFTTYKDLKEFMQKIK